MTHPIPSKPQPHLVAAAGPYVFFDKGGQSSAHFSLPSLPLVWGVFTYISGHCLYCLVLYLKSHFYSCHIFHIFESFFS